MADQLAPATEPQAPTLNPIQAAIAAYQTEATTPLETPAGTAGESAPDQPRDDLGRFASPDRTEPPAEGTAEETDDERWARELEEHRRSQLSDEERAAEDAEAAAPEAEDGEDEGEDDEQPFVLQIRPRREGQEPIELELGHLDEQTQAEIRAALNDGMRRDEFHRQMQQVEGLREQQREFEDRLRVDPVGVLVEHVPADVRRQTVLAILAQDADVYAAVAEELLEWENDDRARELAGLRMQREFDERRTTVADDIRADREAREAATALWGAVGELIPASAEQDDVNDFLADSRQYLMEIAEAREITPAEIPTLLEKRVRRYFGQAAGGAPTAPANPGKQTPQSGVARPGGPKAQELATRMEQARQTGRRFVQASVRRREAAASSPAGAGAAPVTSIKPPKGTGIKGAIEFYRQQGHV